MVAITVSTPTPAPARPANVRILLPAGYSSRRHRRYPVLYLLHGSSGGAADWTSHGGAEQTTAGLGLIVVMPDIALRYDGGGWCTNWWNGGARYRIVVRSGSVVKSFVERTGRGGRLRIDVPLGPSDTVQEYPADGPPLGTTVYRTRVTIGRAGR